MRSLSVLIGLGLVAALVAGIVWLGAGEPMAPPMPAAAATTVAAVDASTTAEPVIADAPSGREGREEPDVEPATDDEAARTMVVPVDQRRAPRVLVVRGEPPVPVPGVVVHFVTDEDAERRRGREAPTSGRTEWPALFGQRATTGADGIATLPIAPAPWLCSAAHDGDFAFAIVPPRDRVFTLVLQRDEQVTLRVRYPGDAPARGVPVALLQQFGADEAQSIGDVVTADDGRATVRHFQLVRQSRAGAAERFAAAPRVPGATAVEFAGRPAQPETIELHLPALASVRVQLVDPRGTPILSRATIGLTGLRPVAHGDDTLKLPQGLNAQRVEKPPGEAPVLLPFHELDVGIQLAAHYATLRRPLRHGPTPGPREPGSVVDVALPLDQNHLLLAGTLVLPGGTPLAGARVDAALWRADRDVLTTVAETIGDGRFDIVLAPRTDAQEFWLDLRIDAPRVPTTPAPGAEPAPPDHRRLGARVRLPALRGGERLELGTIELGEIPALVTGIVVDDEDQPVPDADVQVQVEVPSEQRGAGDQRPRDPWRPLALLQSRSLADGTFRIDGPLPPGNLRVRADTDRHFANEVPLRQQGQQVRLKIDRNGILRGRVLLPDWVPEGATSLQLRPFDAQRQNEARRIDLSARRGGRFVVEPLRPGRFDAIVTLRNLPEPIVVIQDVFVSPGESRDQRFRPLDLRTAVHRYRLRAVDQSGQPFVVDGPIVARTSKADGTIAEAAFRWQKGRAELLTTSPFADLTFFGRGHRTVRATLSPGDQDVVLPAMRPALLELPGARALCGPHRKVRVSVLLQGDTGLPGALGGIDQRTGERFGFQRWDLGRSSGAWLGVTDTVEIPLLQSGRYSVLLRPHATDTERSPQAEVALGVFELQVDSGSWQPVRVPVDPVAVGNALQQLDQNFANASAAAAARGRAEGDRGARPR